MLWVGVSGGVLFYNTSVNKWINEGVLTLQDESFFCLRFFQYDKKMKCVPTTTTNNCYHYYQLKHTHTYTIQGKTDKQPATIKFDFCIQNS